MMRFDAKVETHGPMFDMRGPSSLLRANDDIEDDVANHAWRLIEQRLPGVLRHPTGRYQRSINVVHAADPYVDGEGTIYGRWLEGVGSRNASTRFKGYHTFRQVGQKVEHDADGIADRRLDRWARSM